MLFLVLFNLVFVCSDVDEIVRQSQCDSNSQNSGGDIDYYHGNQ